MNEQENIGKQKKSQNLQVWYCVQCRNVHFKTENVMLDFTKTEFIELTNAMIEIYQKDFDPIELGKLSNAIVLDEDILLSDTIA